MNGDRKMGEEDAQNVMGNMMEKMMEQFVANMTSEDKKKLIKQMMPKMMNGLTEEDRQDLMSSMIPAIMSQMLGRKGEKSSLMPQKGFKPWKSCPCRGICEKGFKTASDES